MNRVIRSITLSARAAVFLAVLPTSMTAQDTAIFIPSRDDRCFATIPPSAMTRVPVYVTVQLRDSSGRVMGNDADLLANSLAEHARAILGADPDNLPVGEPRVTWDGIYMPLHLTVYHNRPLAWSIPGGSETTPQSMNGAPAYPSFPAIRTGAQLLAEALARLRAEAEPFFLWPDSSSMDSARFSIAFTRPTVNRDGKIVADQTLHEPRVLIPVFSLRVPWEAPAMLRKQGNISFPREARMRGAEGTVWLQFVIDTTGRVVPGTMKELLPKNVRKPTGELAALYRTLVEASREHALTSRYKPAEIAGCKVKVLVQQPYKFAQPSR